MNKLWQHFTQPTPVQRVAEKDLHEAEIELLTAEKHAESWIATVEMLENRVKRLREKVAESAPPRFTVDQLFGRKGAAS